MKDKAAFSEKPIPQNTLSSTEKVGTSPYLAGKIPVRRIQIQELVIYDIREDELDDLVRGGRASNYHTNAVWSLSTALTLLSFLFVPSLPKILLAVFAHLTTFGFVVGFLFGSLAIMFHWGGFAKHLAVRCHSLVSHIGKRQ